MRCSWKGQETQTNPAFASGVNAGDENVKNIFVQGDRAGEGLSEQLYTLGRMAAGDDSVTLCLGSAGEIVRILTGETTARCKVFQIDGKSNVAAMRPGVEVLTCPSWGTRMDHFIAGNGYIFFPGAEGTMAHLVPVLAHIKKKAASEQEKTTPTRRVPRVALVDWPTPMVAHVMGTMSIQLADIGYWFANYSVEEAFKFVTS